MDVVGAMGVGELLRGRVVDLGEDERGEGGRLGRGGGGALGEDGGVVSDAGAVGEVVVVSILSVHWVVRRMV